MTAEAVFDVSGNNLIVVLSNVGGDVLNAGAILTGLFFDLESPGLDPVSAKLTPGSSVLFGNTDPNGSVGGEWSFVEAMDPDGALMPPEPQGRTRGLSSTGAGLFGVRNFPGNDLGADGVLGLQYGITSLMDDPTTGSVPVTGAEALIQHSLTFVLSGLPTGFDLTGKIANVWFQYGASVFDPRVQGNPQEVPEPSALLLLGIGLVALDRTRRLRRQ
jgi:hypothetical protein